PSGSSQYLMYRDESLDPPAIVCMVGKTELRYLARAIDDLHAMLNKAGLVADEQVGTRRMYRLDEQGAESARRYIAQVWGGVSARFKLFAENTSPRTRRR
ncbi:MAG TPA: hypothetical protein VET26_01330, partial [Candidatus Sulfotelmatobacter sp.]|nr:hypothetical protein [Candidatus Sulfotelmatobacter sp.]